MGYTVATIGALVANGAEVHVIHWDKKKLTPYRADQCPGVFFYPRSLYGVKEMRSLLDSLNPVLIVVSGWMDEGYLAVAKTARSLRLPVVTCLDNQWRGTARQWLAAFGGHVGYFSQYFSHAWVSGVLQFEYARRIGFSVDHIVFDFYSGDQASFSSAYRRVRDSKFANYPKIFLFVGRLEKVKGIDLLVDAWRMLRRDRNGWDLCLVGNGSLESSLRSEQSLSVLPFMQPKEVVTLVEKAGCFVLPSRREPWGVVLHEFAAGGLPLIATDVVGAAKQFLIPGFNGLLVKPNDVEALALAMKAMMECRDPDLAMMGDRSNQLSMRITPETSAANLLSVRERV